jgi:solute carrier family 25 (mitochondrial uncoupling protein), member 8/9
MQSTVTKAAEKLPGSTDMKEIESRGPKYNGMIGTVKTIVSEEGAFSLWKGLNPGLQRQIIFSGLRVGLYLPVRNFIAGELPEGQNPTLMQKIMSAIITGAIGITVANPTDVVKVRLQN